MKTLLAGFIAWGSLVAVSYGGVCQTWLAEPVADHVVSVSCTVGHPYVAAYNEDKVVVSCQ